jgi:hypothetical protein
MKKLLAALGLGALIVGLGAGAVAWADPGGNGPNAATRKAARECVRQAKTANPDATRSQLLDLAKPCLQQAGVPQDRIDKAAKRIQCLKQAHVDHPDATVQQLRAAVKACVAA